MSVSKLLIKALKKSLVCTVICEIMSSQTPICPNVFKSKLVRRSSFLYKNTEKPAHKSISNKRLQTLQLFTECAVVKRKKTKCFFSPSIVPLTMSLCCSDPGIPNRSHGSSAGTPVPPPVMYSTSDLLMEVHAGV